MTTEVRVTDWLNVRSETGGFEAFMDVPATRPTQFITVERVGGPESFISGVPLLAVQVWAEYRFQAAAAAQALAKELQKLVLESWVARVTVSSVHNFPDPASAQARYQLSVELVTKFD